MNPQPPTATWHNEVGRLEGEFAVRRSPNLGITIFLYIAGILLVMFAIVLLLQAFNE
ncbi:MAG: hypothetical protein F6K28_36055, partial [Microcoleus sp. SIO2G3]|nr:hypothetical protein [Microcoleus sp. SIO2G3]